MKSRKTENNYTMKKTIFFSLALLFSAASFAQVGIGTTTPASSAILDLSSTNKGLLLPRVANTAAVTAPTNGLMIFDLSSNCIKVYQNGSWSNCLQTSAPTVSAVCTGFVGSYCTSALSGTTYVVTLTNNDFAAKQVTPQIADLSLSGITGLSVSAVSPNTVTTINAGASLVVTYTISGTPDTAGTLTGTFSKQGLSCTSTVAVENARAVTAASATPTLCINTALTPITHTTTGATGIGTATGLPAGVTATWASNTLTISGTPTVAGTFNYTVPLTGCGSANATGTITVKPNKTVTVASTTPTVCINTALTPITHTTTGATGIGTVTGLPTGVTAAWASNTLTISGTPTVAGTFNYSIPLTGGCGTTTNATGTIIVSPKMTVTVASATPTVSKSAALTITHTTTKATGIDTSSTGLPAGVTAAWASNTITISGIPTVTGTFNYSIPLTGGCGTTVNATGTIKVIDCGAYVASGVYKVFMCHNLGADTTLDSNTPVQGIHGNYYQWGRAAVVADASTPAAAISGWITTGAANGAWSDSSKTATDPCPTGFRVPTSTQWRGVIDNNTITRTGSWSNDNANFSTAIRFGSGLCLPAAGDRLYTTGQLGNRGYYGNYWSSTESGTNSYNLFFTSSSINNANPNFRPGGFSVRCISE